MNHQRVSFTYKAECSLKRRALGVLTAGLVSKGSIEGQPVKLARIVLVC
jgi:hypothetical protein